MFPLKGCLTDYKDAHSIRPYCWEEQTAAQTQIDCTSLFLHHLAVKRGFRTQRLFVEAPYALDWSTPISGKSFINSFPKINHYKLKKDLIFSTVLHTSAAPDLLQEKSILHILSLKYWLQYWFYIYLWFLQKYQYSVHWHSSPLNQSYHILSIFWLDWNNH